MQNSHIHLFIYMYISFSYRILEIEQFGDLDNWYLKFTIFPLENGINVAPDAGEHAYVSGII